MAAAADDDPAASGLLAVLGDRATGTGVLDVSFPLASVLVFFDSSFDGLASTQGSMTDWDPSLILFLSERCKAEGRLRIGDPIYYRDNREYRDYSYCPRFSFSSFLRILSSSFDLNF